MTIIYGNRFVKRSLKHTSDFVTVKGHNFICEQSCKLLGRIFLSYKSNNREVLLPNFKAIDQTPVELHILKAEKLDVCISPLSANPVTYIICIILLLNSLNQTNTKIN